MKDRGLLHQAKRLSEPRADALSRARVAGLIRSKAESSRLAAVARITGGNFRLLQRLFDQIGRIRTVNEMTAITKDVLEAVRSTLVVSAT